jgi:DNA-binding NarL/FixJ family response regulator
MARVLLADSQPLFNEALEALLGREGEHEVLGSTSSSEEAWALFERLRPELVLVDAAIGLGGSPCLLERIADDPVGARVLVLGDDHDVELLATAVLAGAAGVVAKTYGAATVMRVASAVLAGQGVIPRGMLLELVHRVAASGHRDDSLLDRLSPRERQVLALLSRGWDNVRIGQDRYISQHTVRTHIQNILEKLGMHSKLEAAAFAMQRSLERAASGTGR